MTEETVPETTGRAVDLTLIGEGRWKATNARGGVLPVGSGEDPDFTPVELLLAALGGCPAVTIDDIAGKRVSPERFDVHVSGDKVSDEQGSHVVNLRVTLDIAYPAGDAGDHARALLPKAIQLTQDRYCSVSKTVELATPVEIVQT
ncbi:MAG: OsmC family protein [Nocardioidaceae bacterium]|nr:OsmC family protein [Nocardioidaceae bacterium]